MSNSAYLLNLVSEHKKKINVSFQGSKGSFSEQALEQCFGETINRHAFHGFEQVFLSIERKDYDYGVIPIENTLIGTVFESFDNFLHFPSIRMITDTTLKIVHSLIGLPSSKISDITTIYSQLPGIGQCQTYLARHRHWAIIPYRDTAASVRHVAEEQKIHNAAIASERAAKLYNLKVLKKGIESNKHNYTRFAVITHKRSALYKQIQQNQSDAGFIIFSIKHETGSLLHSLEVFAKHNVNLLKIESRPIIGKPWEYQFVAELDYNIPQDELRNCMHELKKIVTSFHIIGTFVKTKGD